MSLYANDAGRGMRKIQKEFVRIFQEKIRIPPFNIVGEEKLKMQKSDERFTAYFFSFLFLIYALLAAQFESLLFPLPCHVKYSICFGRCDSWFLDYKTYHGCGSYGWNYFVD